QIPTPEAFTFRTALGLQAGTYALRAKYENIEAAAAFSVKGDIQVIGGREVLSNASNSVELQCAVSDTLTLDNYYFYPDSALTICADTDQLPTGDNYVFQWFDANGELLNSSASASQNCFTIAELNRNTTGLYYVVAQGEQGERCFVLPVEVQTYVQDPTGAWYIPNQLVVRYRPGTTEDQRQDLIKRNQATRLDSCMCLIDLLMLPDTIFDENGEPIIDPEEKKKKVGSDDNAGVESVGWNTIMEEETIPAGMQHRQRKSLEEKLAEAKLSPELVASGDSVIVALIDTGFDYTNPAYSDYMWQNPDPFPMSTDSCRVCLTGAEIGYDFGDRDNDPSDTNLHGTFVGEAIIYAAELLSGTDKPRMKIMPLKVMDEKSTITVFNVTCATVFAIRHGAMVINLSMGGYGGYQDILAAGLASVDSGNCEPFVVTSAGNDDSDNTIFDHYFSNLNDSLLNVISVGSLDNDREGNRVKAEYSNFGSNVNLAMTGDAEYDTTPYTNVRGTSISAGYASGVLAFIYDQKPGISWTSAKDCLFKVAEGKGVGDFQNDRGLDLTGQNSAIWRDQLLEHLFALPDEDCTYTHQACIPIVVNTEDRQLPRSALAVKVIPNPTRGNVLFELDLEQSQTLSFQLFDVQGKTIAQFERRLGAGLHQIPFAFAEQPSGVYFYTILSEKYIQSGKIIKQR
ncbi:MAG: S8 family peptidase, partial [Bacteroidota bacterium]